MDLVSNKWESAIVCRQGNGVAVEPSFRCSTHLSGRYPTAMGHSALPIAIAVAVLVFPHHRYICSQVWPGCHVVFCWPRRRGYKHVVASRCNLRLPSMPLCGDRHPLPPRPAPFSSLLRLAQVCDCLSRLLVRRRPRGVGVLYHYKVRRPRCLPRG